MDPPKPPPEQSPVTRRISILRKFHTSGSDKSFASGSGTLGTEIGKGYSSSKLNSAVPSSSKRTVKFKLDGENGAGDAMSRGRSVETKKPSDVNLTIRSSRLSKVCGNPNIPNGSLNGSGGALMGGGGATMRRLLEDLHQSRMLIEQDQKEYEKTRRDIDETDKQISRLEVELGIAKGGGKELTDLGATKKTHLSFVEIRNKVLSNSIKQAERELTEVLEELHKVRMKTSDISSAFLSESVHFSMLWNCTNLGSQNRLRFRQKEKERLDHQKQLLVLELDDFLCMRNGLAECEKENAMLEQKFREFEARNNKAENELVEQIKSLNLKMKDLEHQELELIQNTEAEFERLRNQIEEKENSVTILERKGKEARNMVKVQSVDQNALNARNTLKKSIDPSAGEISQCPADIGPQKNQEDKIEEKSNLAQSYTPFKNRKESFGSTDSAPKDRLDSGRRVQGFGGNNNSNDEDICLAAAAEVSQNMRAYEPMTPTPSYKQHGPPPTKIRVIEHQTPITPFMRQLSTSKVITKPKRPSYQPPPPAQAKPIPNSAPVTMTMPPSSASRFSFNTSKTFQFKKKSVGSNSNNVQAQLSLPGKDLTNNEKEVDDSSFSDNVFQNEFGCPSGTNDFGNTHNYNRFPFPHNKPFTSFNSSRVLLTESQERQLFG